MIPVERLKTIPLFAELDDESLAHLAPLFHRARYRLGDIVSRQGDPGDAFYVLDAGTLRIRRVDANDEESVLGYLNAPAFFGETSLLTSTHRDVTIDVFSKEADLLVLPKHEFEALLTEYPQIQQGLFQREEAPVAFPPEFDWLQPGEQVLVHTRRHWYAMVSRLILPAGISVLLLVIAAAVGIFFSAPAGVNPYWLVSIAVVSLSLALILAVGLWVYVDWSNDYYIVTNKRVIHVEKVVFLFEEREEAPIELVTNVAEMSDGVAARLFHFGDLRVETAGRQVDVDFTYAPADKQIPALIFEQIERVRDRQAFEKRERLRAGIRDDLWQRLAPEEAAARDQARQTIEEEIPAEPIVPVATRRAKRTSLGRRLNELFGLKVESGEQITWRKHWFVLIERVDEPLVAVLIVLGLGFVHSTGIVPIRVLGSAGETLPVRVVLVVLWLILLGAALFWLWYQYVDWSNDIYRVTDDRVVDVERSPFGLRRRSIETTLDRVQDISYVQRNPIAMLFNFGDLIIETAGAGRFTFYGVSNPRAAAREIFRRRDAHRTTVAREQARHERKEFLDWFMEYHRFLQEQGEINPPEPGNPDLPILPPPPPECEGSDPFHSSEE